jgi:hypothetical protein
MVKIRFAGSAEMRISKGSSAAEVGPSAVVLVSDRKRALSSASAALETSSRRKTSCVWIWRGGV